MTMSGAKTRGFVYFLQIAGRGPIKIGFAAHNPISRFRNLQQSMPYTLDWLCCFEGIRDNEKRIHADLSKHRIRGEWYHPHKDVLACASKNDVLKSGIVRYLAALSVLLDNRVSHQKAVLRIIWRRNLDESLINLWCKTSRLPTDAQLSALEQCAEDYRRYRDNGEFVEEEAA